MPEISSIKLNAEKANASPAVGGASAIAKSALDPTSPDRTNQPSNAPNRANAQTDSFAPNEKNTSDYTKLFQSPKETSEEKNTVATGSEASKGSSAANSTESTSATDSSEEESAIGDGLSEEEQKQVNELKSGDSKVKSHEAAHAAVGGELVRGKSFDYAVGPDGKRYAVGGEVQIDISPVANDPRATMQKMQQIRRAALAPSDPSPQDRSVASTAQSIESQAQAEIASQIGKSDAKSEPATKPIEPKSAAKVYTQDTTESSASGGLFDSINSANGIKNLTGTAGLLSE